MPVRVVALDHPQLLSIEMPDRFRHEITYFMSLPDEAGAPAMQPGEFWIPAANSRHWLDEGVFEIVSPLDGQNKTEIELSEEQEVWLEWMVAHQIERVRLV